MHKLHSGGFLVNSNEIQNNDPLTRNINTKSDNINSDEYNSSLPKSQEFNRRKSKNYSLDLVLTFSYSDKSNRKV
jgi:hypothetical protein